MKIKYPLYIKVCTTLINKPILSRIMIVLHFSIFLQGQCAEMSREDKRTRKQNRQGRQDNDQQAHMRGETTVDKSRKDNCLTHNSDCISKTVPQRSFSLFDKMTCHCLSVTNQPSCPPSFGSPQYIPHTTSSFVLFHITLWILRQPILYQAQLQ